MGCKSSKRQNTLLKSLSRVGSIILACGVLPLPAVAEDVLDYISVGQEKYYESMNTFRPRKGKLISPSDVAENGHNFEFCDGTTGKVDISTFEPATPCQSGNRQGPFVALTISADDLEGIQVYDKSYDLIGTIVDVRLKRDGGLDGLTIGAQGPNTKELQEIFIDEASTNGDFLLNKTGELDGYLLHKELPGSN